MARLYIDCPDFDGYMTATLSRSTRHNFRRKFRKAAKYSMKREILADITPIVDEIYPLYLQVFERSSLHFERLTSAFLCELGRRMPDQTRFFVWRLDGRPVAFSVCCVAGDTIYDEYLGMDYSLAFDLHLYHYTLREIIEWGMANGCRWYVSNSLNYDPKHHLRCELAPLDLYVRHVSPTLNRAIKRVLPWTVPARYDRALRQFENYRDLWGGS